METSDHNLRYQKLVALQQSYNVLSKVKFLFINFLLFYLQYLTHSEQVLNFEKQKDEFLSSFTTATFEAIDANDANQLESLREKFSSLDRISSN